MVQCFWSQLKILLAHLMPLRALFWIGHLSCELHFTCYMEQPQWISEDKSYLYMNKSIVCCQGVKPILAVEYFEIGNYSMH